MSSLVKWSSQWKPRSIHRLVQVVLKDHLEDHHPILWASIVAKMTRGTEIFIHLIANRSYRLPLTNLSPLTKSKWTCPSNSLWTLPSMCVLKFKFHSAHNDPWARHRPFPYNQYDADGTHRLRLRNTVSRQTWGMDSRLSQPCYWCWFDKYLVDAIRSFMETSRNAWVWIITGSNQLSTHCRGRASSCHTASCKIINNFPRRMSSAQYRVAQVFDYGIE